jgi:hypothetical protein
VCGGVSLAHLILIKTGLAAYFNHTRANARAGSRLSKHNNKALNTFNIQQLKNNISIKKPYRALIKNPNRFHSFNNQSLAKI